jgi:hypothetical protein
MFYNAYYRSLDAALAGEPGQGGNPAAISRNFRVGPAVCILYHCQLILIFSRLSWFPFTYFGRATIYEDYAQQQP